MYFHSSFKLNGRSFASSSDILKFTKNISGKVYDFLHDWFDGTRFIIVKTSGSTGKPKHIKLKKEFMINSAKATGDFFQLYENTTALLCMSVDYIAGKMMLVRAMVLGWDIDIVQPIANPLATTKKSYDFAAMVPLQLQASLKDLNKLKKIIVGGGVVNNDTLKQLQNFSTKVFATYGMTETVTHVAVKKLNGFSSSIEKPRYEALPGISFEKDDRECLVIHAPKISEEIVITNDIIKLYSNSSFEWVGRYDNIINSGGIKLNPEVIEEKLVQIILRRFFVMGIPDKVLGQKLILIIEGEEVNMNLSDLKKKIDNLEILGRYEKPKEIFVISKFVETDTQKIQRKKTMNLILESKS